MCHARNARVTDRFVRPLTSHTIMQHSQPREGEERAEPRALLTRNEREARGLACRRTKNCARSFWEESSVDALGHTGREERNSSGVALFSGGFKTMFLKSLAAIGFAVDARLTAADLIALLANNTTETLETKSGDYRVCRLQTGAEVSLHIGRAGTPQAGRIIGLTPFHVGDAGMKVCIMGALPLDAADPLAGGYSVFLPALARGDQPLHIVVELTPFVTERAASYPALAEVQLLALVDEAACYSSTSDFLCGAPKDRLVSPGAVSPLTVSGGTSRSQGLADHLRCQALVTGRVRDASRLVNPMSGQAYWWLRLDTDRGPVFMAVNNRTVAGAQPAPGTIIQGRSRLVCRHRGPVTVLRGAKPHDPTQSGNPPTTQQAAEMAERAWPPGAF